MRNSKKSLAITLIAMLVGTFVGGLPTQKTNADPVAVVSVTNIDQLMADVEYLLEATGTDQIAQLFMPQVKAYFQGLNREKPFGMVLNINDGEYQPLVFLPVDDLDAFLNQLRDQVGEPAEHGDGVLELQGPQSIFVKEEGGWAFFGQNVETLDNLPANPEKLLVGLPEKYDVCIRGYVQNIPEEFREFAVQQMAEGMRQGLEDTDDPNAQKVADAQMKQLRQLIEESDEVTFGWNIDSKAKNTHLDFSVTAKADSKLAKQIAAVQNMTTKYAGFIVPNAAISGNFASVIPEDQLQESIAALDGFEQTALKELDEDSDLEDDAVKETAKNLVKGLFDLLRETAKTGTLDSAVSVILEENAMTLALAGHVADGAKVESMVQELVKVAESEEKIFSKKEFNSGTHNGVRLHELAVPIPDDEYISELLGGELQICLGAADNDMYIAVGTDPVGNLKKMIDASKANPKKPTSPFSATIKLAPILKFAESMEEDIDMGGIIAMLESSGNDHIRITATGIENGFTYRFLIEEGVLKAAGQAAQMGMGGAF